MEELEVLRNEINEVDKDMAKLFEKRMEICKKVGKFKLERGISVKDASRESTIIEKNRLYIF